MGVVKSEELATLERRFSAERLAPYRAVCDGDLAAAMALYQWNAEVSAALGTTLGHLEVLLRNALHHELTAWSTRQHGEARWYLDSGQVFFTEAHQDISKARSRATFQGRQETQARNRMAHHEPMFNRPVAELRATALTVAGWICPVTQAWIESQCRVPQLLANVPAPRSLSLTPGRIRAEDFGHAGVPAAG